MTRILLISACLTSIASAQLRPIDPGQIHHLQAGAAALIGSNGQQVGPWIQNSGGVTPASANWLVCFDSMSTDPSGPTSWLNYYGVQSGPYAFADSYKASMWANDAVITSGSQRMPISFVRAAFLWNPNGTTTASGSATAALRFRFSPTFGSSEGPAYGHLLTGVVLTRTNLAAGFYDIEADLRPLGAALMAPAASPSALVVEIGTLNGSGQFAPLSSTAAAQPLLSSMTSPGEPQFPGTNPSSSTSAVWYDEFGGAAYPTNRPDYVLEGLSDTGGQYSERTIFDYTSTSRGILQPSCALFYDTTVRRIAGTVNFQDLADPSQAPKTAEFQIFQGASLIAAQTVDLGTNGSFVLVDPHPAGGTYSISTKSETWLRQTLASVTTTGATVTNISFSLINGDVDGDNEVGLSDFGLLSGAFGSFTGDPSFDRLADLDRDGEVGLSDFGILSTNFGTFGD